MTWTSPIGRKKKRLRVTGTGGGKRVAVSRPKLRNHRLRRLTGTAKYSAINPKLPGRCARAHAQNIVRCAQNVGIIFRNFQFGKSRA